MSFWPFGQTPSHSDIDKILDEYLTVLHRLEKDIVIPSVFRTEASLEGKRTREDKNSRSAFGIDDSKRKRRKEEDEDEEEEEEEDGDDECDGDVNNKENNVDDKRRDDDDNDKINDDSGIDVGLTSGKYLKSDSKYIEDNEDVDDDTIDVNPNEPGFTTTTHTASSSSSNSFLSSRSQSATSMTINGSELAELTVPLTGEETEQRLDSSFIDRMLKEGELSNELAAQNKGLIDFICFGFFFKENEKERVENIDYLLDQLLFCVDQFKMVEADTVNVTRENSPADEGIEMDFNKVIEDNAEDEDEYSSRANLIAEIFSLDIWLITESSVKNKEHLSKIWNLLHNPNFKFERSPLIPIFLKMNQNLLITRQDQYLNFIRSQSSLVDDMLMHIDIALSMDFFLKLISTDKIESPTGVIELVSDQKLIDKLLKFLNNNLYSADIQACVCDFLKASIVISANAPLDELSIGPNSLTRRLASPKSIDKMIKIVLNERGAALNSTISIVIESIRKNNSDYDQVNLLDTTLETHPPSDRDPIFLGYLSRRFAANLPKLFEIIDDIYDNNDTNDDMLLTNQMNEKFIPIGFERFKIVESIAELLHCSNMGLLNTKRAERIARVRDKVRKQVSFQLQDALNDLTINPSVDNKRKSDTAQQNDKHDAFDGIQSENESHDEFEHINQDENDEIDETFEIPYINENQNSKSRTNPTIGDLFKIKLYDCQIIPKIMKLFLNHPWNNFWHNVIFDIIQQIFNGRMDFSYNSFLVFSLFNSEGSFQYMDSEAAKDAKLKDFSITKDFILEGYHKSYKFYEEKNTNLGFMGHLVLIAEEVVKFSKLYKVELISTDIQDSLQEDDWQYYSEEVLNRTRLMYSKILGGGNFVEDANGNIVPQMNDGNYLDYDDENDVSGGKLINVENLEEQLSLSTESDLHLKLRDMLVVKAQQEVDAKNAANGVIILGGPEEIPDNQ